MWIIENESDVCGVWTTPEKAVTAYYGIPSDGGLSRADSTDTLQTGMSPSEVVKVLLANDDYPCLTKIPVDPVKVGVGLSPDDAWYRDC